jgi:Ca2+-binding RTX toxin-like protein
MSGGAGNDYFVAMAFDSDVFRGGAGFDLVDRRGVESPVDVNLTTNRLVSDGFVDRIPGVEGFVAGPAGDTLTGDDGANLFRAYFGDDEIAGLGGDDLLYAGSGNDTVDGGDGTDRCGSAETAANCEL